MKNVCKFLADTWTLCDWETYCARMERRKRHFKSIQICKMVLPHWNIESPSQTGVPVIGSTSNVVSHHNLQPEQCHLQPIFNWKWSRSDQYNLLILNNENQIKIGFLHFFMQTFSKKQIAMYYSFIHSFKKQLDSFGFNFKLISVVTNNTSVYIFQFSKSFFEILFINQSKSFLKSLELIIEHDYGAYPNIS